MRLTTVIVVALSFLTGCAQSLSFTTPSPEVEVQGDNWQLRVHVTGAAGQQDLGGAVQLISGSTEVQGQAGGCIATGINTTAIPDNLEVVVGGSAQCIVRSRELTGEE